jgi:hypothetical protein
MNLLRVNFQELYERHLCRHSQFGINVIHLATVICTYLAMFAILAWIVDSWWLLLALPIVYLATIAANLPLRVLIVTALFLALFLALFAVVPRGPVWVYPIAIVALYKIQAWSHRIYTVATDMTEFNKKYPKGPKLFVLLSLYELPPLLYYLVFGHGGGRLDRPTTREPEPAASGVKES